MRAKTVQRAETFIASDARLPFTFPYTESRILAVFYDGRLSDVCTTISFLIPFASRPEAVGSKNSSSYCHWLTVR